MCSQHLGYWMVNHSFQLMSVWSIDWDCFEHGEPHLTPPHTTRPPMRTQQHSPPDTSEMRTQDWYLNDGKRLSLVIVENTEPETRDFIILPPTITIHLQIWEADDESDSRNLLCCKLLLFHHKMFYIRWNKGTIQSQS